MKLDEKRQVIEALLCAAHGNDTVSLFDACDGPGPLYFAASEWVRESYYRRHRAGTIAFSDRLADSAYRLAAGSSVLRREWFGAR